MSAVNRRFCSRALRRPRCVGCLFSPAFEPMPWGLVPAGRTRRNPQSPPGTLACPSRRLRRPRTAPPAPAPASSSATEAAVRLEQTRKARRHAPHALSHTAHSQTALSHTAHTGTQHTLTHSTHGHTAHSHTQHTRAHSTHSHTAHTGTQHTLTHSTHGHMATRAGGGSSQPARHRRACRSRHACR